MKRLNFQIIDLDEEHKDLYYVCLSDWSEEMQKAREHKKVWFERMEKERLKVKLAIDDRNNTCGMIQYLPIEKSFALGEELYFILCIWVYGHKKGIGKYQKKGIGSALLKAAEEDAQGQGTKGMAAWGISLPVWMKASWFRKKGYQKIDKKGMSVLLWKKFSPDALPPKWIHQEKIPEKLSDRVLVTCFKNGWCQAGNLVFELAKEAAKEFKEWVEFRIIDTSVRENLITWGITDALFINEKNIFRGKPPTLKKIKKRLKREIKKITGAKQ